MSTPMIAGQNANIPENICIEIQSSSAIDCAAYRLDARGQVRGDGDMIFYGQRQSDDAHVRYAGDEMNCHFELNLAAQPAAIERIALAYSAENIPENISLRLFSGAEEILSCVFEKGNRREKALILGECYRRNGSWKFRCVAQGFDGGLKPLSERFGVEIADDAPPPPSIKLSKIVLDKAQPKVSLIKKERRGEIRINLNWNRAAEKGGLISNLLNKKQSLDLDLGAFIRLKSGYQDCVQALGGHFGSLQHEPWLRLRADDRTGSISEGEWLDVNAARWAEIDEILIYAFIYEGAPNWSATDGVVTMYVEEQEIETRLLENGHLPMCAIARLINENGGIRIERLERYFTGHREMDQALGWGFQWTRGSK